MGKPPAMPKRRSKMDSFMFTPDFIKGDKLEGNVSTVNATDLKSNVTVDELTTTSETVVEANDKAVHKPLDLYKAIFSDDSYDGDDILRMPKHAPEKVERG